MANPAPKHYGALVASIAPMLWFLAFARQGTSRQPPRAMTRAARPVPRYLGPWFEESDRNANHHTP